MTKRIVFLFILELFGAVTFGQSADLIAAQDEANTYVTSSGLRQDPKNNVIKDDHNTIHIFLFEDGNSLIKSFPTTATEKSKFQVHLYVRATNKDNYLVEYIGSFNPSFNVQGTNPNPIGAADAANASIPVPPQRIDFAVAGPFTGNLVINVKHLVDGNYNGLVSSTIKIAKTIHASIGAGPIYTTLKNPSNYKTLALPNGENTLLADDNGGRALLGLFATFYPLGRNELLMPTWYERFGVVVGTGIVNGTNKFTDAFVGAQYDFAIGGSLIAGLHYGKVERVSGIDYKNFVFGQTSYPFTGSIDDRTYTTWKPGFFVGIQVDSRVFSQIFK